MFYYYDHQNNYQGPFSEDAITKWYVNEYLPSGTVLYDMYHRKIGIDQVVRKSLKSKTKVMFCDESFCIEKDLDRTELDVTLDLNISAGEDVSSSSGDFTQIEEGVDEVDCGHGSENDFSYTSLQRMVNIYVDRRCRNAQNRRIPDTYVPFEYAWNRWVPHPLNLNDALRGAIHISNLLQQYDAKVFSLYLETLNIKNHSCYLCHVAFRNSFEMLAHFLSVVHIHRTYDMNQNFSMIDINCVQKMMSEVDMARTSNDYSTINQTTNRNSFFAHFDITTGFESLKSTVTLSRSVPLLVPPSQESFDGCEYIEILLYLREFERNYYKSEKSLRGRRFGATSRTRCSYCEVEFDGTFLDSFPKHLLSDTHIHNTLRKGVSRAQVEYWISFSELLIKKHRSTSYKRPAVSLQEGDFPLCYRLVETIQGDFIYSGGDVDQIMNYVREKVRCCYQPLLEDTEYRTCCRWCQTELFSRNGVLRHVLYDKCHQNHLKVISNDDLRRLFRLLDISITMPLFRESTSSLRTTYPDEKRFHIQRLRNVCYRVHKRNAVSHIAMNSFPMGLVNHCDLCEVDIEHVDGLLTHFCSALHTQKLQENSRISISDIDCWNQMFSVRNNTMHQ